MIGRSAERSVRGSASDDCWQAVRAAATRLAGAPGAEDGGAAKQADRGHRFETLLSALHRAAEGVGDESHHDLLADAGGYRRQLESLNREAVRHWIRLTPPPPSAELLKWMAAFERVREILSPSDKERGEQAWDPPPGVDLVVELAHDLRSPLTSIIFLAEALRGGQVGPVNDLQRRQLGIIYSAALNLTSMASDVIELSRERSRLMERRPTPFSIAELLDSTREILLPLVEEKNLVLRTEATEEDQRLGHPVALNRVLLNLASNATKFTEAGSVDIVARATGPTSIEFSVSDTGSGIDEQTEKQLFQPFRLNPRTNRFGLSGSGLGLAISRRLVADLGGELRYETVPTKGTRFFFEIELPPVPSA